MKAVLLHDDQGRILSVAVTDADIDLQLVPDTGQSVLIVDAPDVGISNEKELSASNSEKIRQSLAGLRTSARVDVHLRKVVRA